MTSYLTFSTYRLDVPHERPSFAGFKVWRSERSGGDKGGGGLALYYKESLRAHTHRPPVSPDHAFVDNERQWLLIEAGRTKIAFLHLYMACVSFTNRDFIDWNSSIFSVLTSELQHLRGLGFTIICLGNIRNTYSQF